MKSLPEAFRKNILSLFPEEAGYFFDAMSNPAITSIRVNAGKPSTAFEGEEQVEWCSSGRYLPQRPSFIEDPLFHAGAYYVQESSSMFLHYLLQHILPKDESLVALDLCASPGGKSTLMLDALPKGSLLVSNEIIKGRVPALQENIMRWGNPHSVISNNDPKLFKKLGPVFDLILVDAPCSGEGLWRRDPEAMDEWSEAAVSLCAGRQERIIADVLPSLKPGGVLIYSTCTFNEEENEAMVSHLVQTEGLELMPLDVPNLPMVKSLMPGTFRFLPHKVKGEGLFMAALHKPGEMAGKVNHPRRTSLNFAPKKMLPLLQSFTQERFELDYFMENDFVFAFPKKHIPIYEVLRATLYIRHAGICMGKMDKAGQLIPDHSLALSICLNNQLPSIELTKEEALLYMKKGNLVLNQVVDSAWYLASYKGLKLGWMKVLPNRINNYFPAEYRILKDIQ